jgi:outer membrane receptor protein involved in Fe transport
MKMNKYNLTFLFLLFFSAGAFAQYPQAQVRPNAGGRNMNVGHFYGKVIDGNTNKPVEAASVQLTQMKFDTTTKQRKSVIVAAMLTDKKGEFSIDKLPLFGKYNLTISAVGHSVYTDEISFDLKMGGDRSQMMNAIDKDLGNIKLLPEAKQLADVVVTANKPMMQMSIDRKVFNVDKSLTSVGGTAVDVMRNVPSVNVDIDGNVTLRNASPQIFVDGRPTTLTLDEIPADEIESIEIITNPSAKFDASGGGAGILNIVMKKNKKTGYNGNVRAGVDTQGGNNAGGNINIRQGKINFFANGNYFHFKGKSTNKTDRTDYVNGLTSDLQEYSRPLRNGRMAGGDIGFDYFMDNRNTLTISGGIRRGKFGGTELMDISRDTTDGGMTTHTFGTSNSNSNFTWDNYNGKISFKHNFAKPNKYITADANYNHSKNTNEQDMATQYFKADNTPSQPLYQQKTTGNGSNNNIIIQTDYSNPVSDKIKVEAGLRAAMRSSSSANNNFIMNQSTGKYESVQGMNSKYKYEDNVYAGYVTFSQKIHDFTYQLGGRIESSKYSGELIDSNETFSNSFPLSFFPSVFLTQKINDKQDIQLNYSRKINRPNFWQLIPYYDFTDPLNISVGNASLVPEFTNLFELSYNLNLKNGNNFIATAYFRQSNNLISRYQYWDKNPNPAYNDSVFISSYVNANSSEAYGLELTSMNKIASWWTLTENVNFYNSQINGSNLSTTGISNQKWSWFGKINSTFNLPAHFTLQINGDYTSKTILPPGRGGGEGNHWGGGNLATANGYALPVWGFDAAIKKDFLKDKTLSVSLSMNDIFDTRVTKVHSVSTSSKDISSVQDIWRQRDPQQLRLNVSWRFGKADFSLFKRKDMNQQGDQTDMPPMAQ